MEPLTQTFVVPIQDGSQIALGRRAAADLARNVGLDEKRVSAAGLVAVELGNNLLQHAGGGNLYIRYIEPIGALDIAAVDHGKGMPNVERCLDDGFTTASTPGLGLGAVRRLATRFGAHSQPARTTVVAARMAEHKPCPNFSVICTPIRGELVSGDSWAVSDDGNSFLVVDGLGHGMFAAEAAAQAVGAFRRHQNLPPARIIEFIHIALRATRGAAASIATVQPAGRVIEFAGIGNVSCMLLSNKNKTQNFISHNGTLGHQLHRVQQFKYTYQPGDSLLMQSDGLSTQSRLGIPPSLLSQSPIVLTPFLFSEQARGRDDATLLVARLD